MNGLRQRLRPAAGRQSPGRAPRSRPTPAGGLGTLAVLTLAAALVSSCAAREKVDYQPYRMHMPHSILVLPPMNESLDVEAPASYLSTISRPIAECGYYVYPVAVIDSFLKENGIPDAAEAHAISLVKIHEVIGADAVLYVTIEDWGQKYQVISSTTIVKARAKLVDVATGTVLWTGTSFATQGSGDAGGGAVGMLVNAVLTQVVSSISDPTYDLSRQANTAMVFENDRGFLMGPRHPGYDTDGRGR